MTEVEDLTLSKVMEVVEKLKDPDLLPGDLYDFLMNDQKNIALAIVSLVANMRAETKMVEKYLNPEPHMFINVDFEKEMK